MDSHPATPGRSASLDRRTRSSLQVASLRRLILCSVVVALVPGCSCSEASEPSDAGEPPVDAGEDAGNELCWEVSCDAPPAAACVDGDTLRTYELFGRCTTVVGAAGEVAMCSYESGDLTCPGGCAAGQCTCEDPPASCSVEELAFGQAMVRSIALDTTHVYWIDADLADPGGRVMRRPKDGGPNQVLATGQDRPSNLAVDATHVYWTNNFGNQVMRVPKGGGSPDVFAADQSAAYGIAVDDTHVYWTANERVMRRAKSGAEIEELAAGQGVAAHVALDATHVYWLALSTGTDNGVRRRAKSGGPIEDVVMLSLAPAGIALDASHVYWTSVWADQVARRPKTGGPVEELASGQDGPNSIGVDETHIYWTNQTGDQVMRQPIGGGPVEELASAQDSARSIALDAAHVYWGTHHEVRRLSRCCRR